MPLHTEIPSSAWSLLGLANGGESLPLALGRVKFCVFTLRFGALLRAVVLRFACVTVHRHTVECKYKYLKSRL
ncbi:hypothetical protein N431DRAFT_424720 [Stipitochalara longipes BDJ]|nr:hypothetical protein N431DRAFT_424720 [Stipitochalara longipes BDJ]